MIMKKTDTNCAYSSPSAELLSMACEQAVMSASVMRVPGVDNEEFVPGGSFSDWQ